MESFYILFLFFCVCSFFGWIIESVYGTIKEKRFTNSGFLYGPFVPIYGSGALFIYLIDIYTLNLFLPIRLIIYFLIPTIIEYITSYLMEKIFNLRLWDYSNHKFNLHGRICLLFSFIWFVLVLLDVLMVQPFLINLFKKMPYNFTRISSIVLSAYLVIDIFFSSKLYYYFSKIKNALILLNESKMKINYKKILIDNPILLKIMYIFKPIKTFPHLGTYIKKEWLVLINKMQNLLVDNIKSKNIMNYKNNTEFNKLIEDIISHSEYQKLKTFHHHEHSIYEHSIHVAWLSYNIGKYLEKYFKINIIELTRGALLHDFFLYNWRTEKPASGKLHAFEHPKEALNNALLHFNSITPIEKDIILKHMWPLNILPPRYIETLIVLIVDKLVASKEFISEFIKKRKSLKNIIKKQL